MTDPEILERILRGHLHVCHQTMEISMYHTSHRRWYAKATNQHPKSGRVRVALGPAGKRRSVYRNRLVWMYFNRALIPDGYQVDHIDEDNQNDHPSNLRLLTQSENAARGYRKQMDKNAYNWRCFFDYIEFTGAWPPDDHFLWR